MNLLNNDNKLSFNFLILKLKIKIQFNFENVCPGPPETFFQFQI